MDLRLCFIGSGKGMSTLDRAVPAPYFRKYFCFDKPVRKAVLDICGLGFYKVYWNGAEFTKGLLAPYISNPDHIMYYDRYDVTDMAAGRNVLGILLGNGLLNNPGGFVWDFDKAPWRSAPMAALRLLVTFEDGQTEEIISDQTFETADSPILFDDYRLGENYDAGRELPGWCCPDAYEGQTEEERKRWKGAVRVTPPKGRLRLCRAEPICVAEKRKPVAVIPCEGGYLYDFGKNDAGVCCLQIQGEKGQKVILDYGDWYHNGRLDKENLNFRDQGFVYGKDGEAIQRDIYICKDGPQSYLPSFTYHGFQYVLVTGIREGQAGEGLLTCHACHSGLEKTGGFQCSDKMANDIFACAELSDLSNFYYFPTDCPGREKNGWLGDASLSAEHMILTYGVKDSFREWLHNIREAQLANGSFPGIVPGAGWGDGIYGPSHEDAVIVLPYYIYRYTGDTEIIRENAQAVLRYLRYLASCKNERGLLDIGLGDWCQIGAAEYGGSDAPDETVISIFSYQLAEKAEVMFRAIGWEEGAAFSGRLRTELKQAVRSRLIDWGSMTVMGECQTCQAMALHYHIFEEEEEKKAFSCLMGYLEKEDYHMKVGVWGARVLFHVLSRFGESQLAYEMVTRPDYPSYGNLVKRGATTLWEEMKAEGADCSSLNHHFWGDVNSWMIQEIAGIKVNPQVRDPLEVRICPHFVEKLDFAQAWHRTIAGVVQVRWEREKERIVLKTDVPEGVHGRICLPAGWHFGDGSGVMDLRSGEEMHWLFALELMECMLQEE